MDDEENNPGHAQIPLINDLVFDESLPLKAPPKKRAPAARNKKPAAARKKSKSIPPGYDPDTGDLFGELEDEYLPGEPEEFLNEVLEDELGEADIAQPISEELKAELEGELESVLKALDTTKTTS